MLTQKLVLDNCNMLKEIASHIKLDYGNVYTPTKIAKLFGISFAEATIFLDQLTEKRKIKRLNFEDLGEDLNLYFCDKPNL